MRGGGLTVEAPRLQRRWVRLQQTQRRFCCSQPVSDHLQQLPRLLSVFGSGVTGKKNMHVDDRRGEKAVTGTVQLRFPYGFYRSWSRLYPPSTCTLSPPSL